MSSINREALVRKRRRLPRSANMLLLSMKLTTKSGPQRADTEESIIYGVVVVWFGSAFIILL